MAFLVKYSDGTQRLVDTDHSINELEDEEKEFQIRLAISEYLGFRAAAFVCTHRKAVLITGLEPIYRIGERNSSQPHVMYDSAGPWTRGEQGRRLQ